MKRKSVGVIVFFALAGRAFALDPHPTLDRIPVCYNYGCAVRQVIGISQTDWGGVAGWFYPAATAAAQEREQIRHAIGWIEVLVGRQTPTHRDKGRNPYDVQWPGQLDCIDESLNTTTYLRLLQAEGLLKWHRVLDRVRRRTFVDQHWAGQIEQINTGKRYVVDSWFLDNGTLPYVQKLDDWADVSMFSSTYHYVPSE